MNSYTTTYLGYLIFAFGVLAGFLSPKSVFSPLISLGGAASVIGFLFLLCTPFSKIKIRSTELGVNKPLEPAGLVMLKLWFGQGILFILTFVFLFFISLQTQKSPQLQPVKIGDLFNILNAHILTVGILPWIVFAILGVGLAYFSVCKNETALLYRIICPNPKTKLTQFLDKYLWIIYEVGLLMPYLILMGAAIFLLGDGLSSVFGLPSLLETPYRSILLWVVILFSFRKSNSKVLDWMREKKFSMGTRLAFYTVAFVFLLVFLQAGMQLFSFKTGESPIKSPLAGSFSESELNFRLTLLCWGWWGIWVPWMSSFIARYSIGFSVGRAVIHAVILPLTLFYVLSQHIERINQTNLEFLFQIPFVEVLAGLGCLLFITGSLRKVYNFSHLTGGIMPGLGSYPKKALTKVISFFIACLVTFIPSQFALGWLPTQVILTFSGAFMLTLVIGFIAMIGLELARFILSSGYRAEY